MANTKKPKNKRCQKGTRKCPKIGECKPVFDLMSIKGRTRRSTAKKRKIANIIIKRRCSKGSNKCADKLKCYSLDENGNIKITDPLKKKSELDEEELLEYKARLAERRKVLRAEKAARLANLPDKQMDPNLRYGKKNLEEIKKANREYEDNEASITTSDIDRLRNLPAKKTLRKPPPAAAPVSASKKKTTKPRTRSEIAKQLMRKK